MEKLGSIPDRLYKYIRQQNKGLSNPQIVSMFMKINNVNPDIAKRLIEPILEPDPRFIKDRDGYWVVKENLALEERPIDSLEWVIFYIDRKYKIVSPAKQNLAQEKRGLKEYSSFYVYKNGFTSKLEDISDILDRYNNYIFVPYDRGSLTALKNIYRLKYMLPADFLTLSIKNIAFFLYPEKKLNNWNDLIREFFIENTESHMPDSKAKTALNTFEFLLEELRSRGIRNLKDIFSFVESKRKKFSFDGRAFSQDYLKNLPEHPGIYIFYNRNDTVIYVGKASNLYNRINSYFWNTGESPKKIEGILKEIHRIEHRLTGSDLEAVMDEFSLIKKYKPKYNIMVNIPDRGIKTPPLMVLLPSVNSNEIVIYLINNSLPPGKFILNSKNINSIVPLISKYNKNEEYTFNEERALLLSYLKRYEERLNVIELQDYRSTGDVIKAILNHLKEIETLNMEKRKYI